jgi:hypothetical protein
VIRPVVALIMLAGASLAASAEGPNVQALLADGFAVVGVMPSPAGPGLFLQKADKLFACFVAETPTSPDLRTRYCKPVH